MFIEQFPLFFMIKIKEKKRCVNFSTAFFFLYALYFLTLLSTHSVDLFELGASKSVINLFYDFLFKNKHLGFFMNESFNIRLTQIEMRSIPFNYEFWGCKFICKICLFSV